MLVFLYYYYCVIALCGGQGNKKLAHNATLLFLNAMIKMKD